MSPEAATIVTWVGSTIAAAVTAGSAYLFTKWREREAEWRKEKIEVYKEFVMTLGAYFEETGRKRDVDVRERFVSACNKLNLVAPQHVIEALKVLVGEAPTRDASFESRVSRVFYEIRRDMKISPSDDVRSFGVRIWQIPEDHPNG